MSIEMTLALRVVAILLFAAPSFALTQADLDEPLGLVFRVMSFRQRPAQGLNEVPEALRVGDRAVR